MVEFFTAARDLLIALMLSGIMLGVALTPCWAVGALGLMGKSRLAHVLPLTALLWVALTLYTGVDWWIYKSGR